MKKYLIAVIVMLFYGLVKQPVKAQTNNLYGDAISGSNFLTVQPIPDRTVFYSLADTGISKPIIWGLDLAWLSESNIRRGIAFMGLDGVDLVRSSFTPTAPLINGELQANEMNILNQRLSIIDLLEPNAKVVLNCDHPSVDPWFKGNAARWAQLIDVTVKHHQQRGRTVVTVSPFNEPDYTATGQGTLNDFYNIAGELKNNPNFDNIRISGGNTLNPDVALDWYMQLKTRLDEGNTHQLAGSFDSYASFYETVRANGHHASNDELHNVMEAMVGVEYGLQTGIWWGTAEFARGEFVKASDGKRLGYAEHRPNWTAASVYRHPEGKVQAFVGSSERQASTTTYRFVSKDKDVFYDGHGPQREYTVEIPGGTGYQQGQTNAEKVVNISWGDDIQPVIDGKYVLVNRKSGKVLEIAGGSYNAGANLQQNTANGSAFQQWNVNPVDSRVGGDFSYFSFISMHSAKAIDILNWSLDNGGNVIVWDNTKGANQQWYLEYANDGWFYIRSRHSALCLEVANASSVSGANVQQWENDGGENQQWRFIPVDAAVEFNAPEAPKNLLAFGNAESIRLNWSANSEPDFAAYTIFRSEIAGGPYQTIARNVKTLSFVDNTVTAGGGYYYTIKAVDRALNQSSYAAETYAVSTGDSDLVVQYQFEENTYDYTQNLNHCATFGEAVYVDGKVGQRAINLNGTDVFIQLPTNLLNHREITIATWVHWNGGVALQRIFDFGNNADEYLLLSPSISRKLRFAIKNGGEEQGLNGPLLPDFEWSHVAVTLGANGASLYLNGEQVDHSDEINIRPIDIKPILNYIGRSQDPDLNRLRLFDGYIDDFRVYNYELSQNDIALLVADTTTNAINIKNRNEPRFVIGPVPANESLFLDFSSEYGNTNATVKIFNASGNVVLQKNVDSGNNTKLDVSILPAGIYVLKLENKNELFIQKISIRHTN